MKLDQPLNFWNLDTGDVSTWLVHREADETPATRYVRVQDLKTLKAWSGEFGLSAAEPGFPKEIGKNGDLGAHDFGRQRPDDNTRRGNVKDYQFDKIRVAAMPRDRAMSARGLGRPA